MFAAVLAGVRSVQCRMLSGMARSTVLHQRSLKVVKEVGRAAIESVSPHELVGRSVRVAEEVGHSAAVISVGGREYTLNHNVKVVAFGKAVLGMVDALESLLGDHIITGIASVPSGAVNTHKEKRRVRILEGAADNLPDTAAMSAAGEILALCREAGEGEVVMALISGGGSALLPCPIQGVKLEEKRKMIEVLAKAGASIQELNTFRKYFSQTKGGKLAEATYSAKMVALVLSDVIGDPLDTIASGPTVPSDITHNDVTTLMDKYCLNHLLPSSIRSILSHPPSPESTTGVCAPIENGSYKHVQNVIVGSNKISTAAAADKARSMGYNSVVWSHTIQGEAKLVGEAYAILAHRIATHQHKQMLSELKKESCFVELTRNNPALLREFEQLESALSNINWENPCNLCLISGGEPTVTVTGSGRGGRNQELALSFSLKYNQLAHDIQQPQIISKDCILMCLGTDGQDGPTDAAGAIGHHTLIHTATIQGLDGEELLRQNDSYSFFSQLEGGQYLLKTGLTGTNVMDIHCILFTHYMVEPL